MSDPDKLLEGDEDLLINDNLKARSLHTPGHTPGIFPFTLIVIKFLYYWFSVNYIDLGSTCFHFESKGVIFTGDTLFKGIAFFFFVFFFSFSFLIIF